MTEERQPNTGPMCEGPYCGKCGKDLSGLTCCYVPGESSYCLEHAPTTQPNTELRAEDWLSNRGLADLSVHWPQGKPHLPGKPFPTLHSLMEEYANSRVPSLEKSALGRGPVKTEYTPANTELREKAREMFEKRFFVNTDARVWTGAEMIVFADDFAASIQEEFEHEFDERTKLIGKLREAEKRAFEIHNRFCGENGEPCQVCRLKAEREAK